MAYGTIYYAHWTNTSQHGYLYIDKLDYIGVTEELRLTFRGLKLTKNWESWENPIIGSQLEFEIVDLKENYWELMPLLNAEEKQYKVRLTQVIDNTEETLFDGFINCEPSNRKYLRFNVIRLVSSNYLYKLDYDHPASIDVLQTKTFIDIINEILVQAGSEFNVRVNISIHAEGDILTATQTALNKNGFFTELFWEDEVKRVSSLQILTEILKSFNAYIYWENGYWYIERYKDIWQTTKNYVEYDYTESYSPSSEGTLVTKNVTTNNINSKKFRDSSQTFNATPGKRQITIDLNDKSFQSLSSMDMKTLKYNPIAGATLAYPNIREWLFSVISLTPSYNDHFIAETLGTTFGIIKNGFNWVAGIPQNSSDYDGITTKFKVTVNERGTSLNIKFSYAFVRANFINFLLDQTKFKYEEWDFEFRYYLKISPGNEYIRGVEDVWTASEDESLFPLLTTQMVSGTSFDNVNDCVEVSFSVPLGKVQRYFEGLYKGYLEGDYDMILFLGKEKIINKADDTIKYYPISSWWGDVEISISGETQDNEIKGQALTKYLDNLDIELSLFDCINYGYKNAILRDPTLTTRTERWGTAQGINHILSKGVCWNTTGTPTVADDKTIDGTGVQDFVSKINSLQPDTTYYVRAYVEYDGGIVYGNERTFKTDVLTVGAWYQGGLIAYIYQPDDPGYVVGAVHGIIICNRDLNPISGQIWGKLSGGGPYQVGDTSVDLGQAQANTELIDANTFQRYYACKLVVDYVSEGYEDWWWPTLWDLAKIWANRDILGLSKRWYWSSSEQETTSGHWKRAYAVDMARSVRDWATWDKDNKFAVRAIHYF